MEREECGRVKRTTKSWDPLLLAVCLWGRPWDISPISQETELGQSPDNQPRVTGRGSDGYAGTHTSHCAPAPSMNRPLRPHFTSDKH